MGDENSWQGGQGVGSRKGGNFGYGRHLSTKVVVEVPDQRMVAFEEPDTKHIDMHHAKKDNGLKVNSIAGSKFSNYFRRAGTMAAALVLKVGDQK